MKDYLIYYLEKHIGTYYESYSYIIELLLNLRFSKEKNIIKDSETNHINIIIIKIIWIESNLNFILNILKIFEIGKDIVYDKDGIDFSQKIYDSIYDVDSPIKYIVDEERNPEFTREVNECFYLLFAGFCLSITSKDIKLSSKTVKDYNDRLKDINKILQNIKYDLYIHINELYIIEELIKIIDYELEKGITSLKNLEDIREILIENSKIIQKNQPTKISDLNNNFLNLNNKLKEEKDENFKNKYYDMLKYIY